MNQKIKVDETRKTQNFPTYEKPHLTNFKSGEA